MLKREEILNSFLGSENFIIFDKNRDGIGINEPSFFYDPNKIIVAFKPSEVTKAIEELSKHTGKYYIAGYMTYEAGLSLLDLSSKTLHNPKKPLLWFGLFERKHKLPLNLFSTETTPEYSDFQVRSTMTEQDYLAIFGKIKDEIKCGNTYQVNFTYDINIRTDFSSFELYNFLRRDQKTEFCTFIKNEYEEILSFSPELFYSIENGTIRVKPMKGTAPRNTNKVLDKETARTLFLDEKNRAENLMIVDLMRNDLGRICQSGSVKTDSLFDIETYKTVHQMTSAISGKLKENIDLLNIFKSIYPCGSITGAPKIETMKIIDNLENSRREVYCGAIGLIDKENSHLFSVPIRTLHKDKDSELWKYHTGGGITWDSDPKSEWSETQDKSKLITGRIPKFEIIETLLIENGNAFFLKEHINRMQNSARRFSYPFNRNKFLSILNIEKNTEKSIVRISLKINGEMTINKRVFEVPKTKTISISPTILNSSEIYLRHKTTLRPWFADTMKAIDEGRFYDVIFLNEKNEICEGARSNIFLKKKGKIYTPPISSGLLPGILRNHLLSTGKCFEKTLTMNDISEADSIYCGNSVRNLVEVNLLNSYSMKTK